MCVRRSRDFCTVLTRCGRQGHDLPQNALRLGVRESIQITMHWLAVSSLCELQTHRKLTVWAHIVSSLWANWVSSKWAYKIIQVSSLWVWCLLTPSQGCAVCLYQIYQTQSVNIALQSAWSLSMSLLPQKSGNIWMSNIVAQQRAADKPVRWSFGVWGCIMIGLLDGHNVLFTVDAIYKRHQT